MPTMPTRQAKKTTTEVKKPGRPKTGQREGDKGVRITGESHSRLTELAILMSSRLGVRVTMAEAIGLSIQPALDHYKAMAERK